VHYAQLIFGMDQQ